MGTNQNKKIKEINKEIDIYEKGVDLDFKELRQSKMTVGEFKKQLYGKKGRK